MNNLSSYYGLTDSRMSASDTDLPVISSKGKGNVWSLTFKAFQNNMKNSGIIQNYLRRC